MLVSDHLSAFWGKAQPREASPSQSHPLIAHSLDVAAVSSLLPRGGLSLPGSSLGWLAALHDIGKFSRPFQAKVQEHWPALCLGIFNPDQVSSGPKHDALTLGLLTETASDLVDSVLPPRQNGIGWLASDRARVFRALAGHHGRPVAMPDMGRGVLGPECEAAARAFVQAMTDVFRPPPIPCPADPRALAQLEWELAGLITLADWVGSRQSWFPYAAETAVRDPSTYYWTCAMPRAAVALAEAGLLRARASTFRGLHALFPAVATPSPIQHWAGTAVLPDGPVLVVVEDLTGGGKTEAAVTLVHRLIASGRAHGMFLALPTTATANAMFDRMASAYERLFAAESRPSLALAHGKASLDPRFAPAFAGGPEHRERPSSGDPADETAESHCSSWLADDRRRALLAEVGVGTIDQALLAVLPVRHATLRQFGLRGKVLVIDEAHAFDPYMREELRTLLQFHAAMGGSAVLLSATLPHATCQALVDAFRKGLGAAPAVLRSTEYPLATLTGAGTVQEQACAPRKGLPRTVTVTRAADERAVLARVLAAERAGAAVAWVRNTVDDALAAAALLRAEGLEPMVFHARFAMCDRLLIEAAVLRRFGKNAEAADRAGILVATQVVESSLDLDFDLLCTDLAPMDSLIQRAGRLFRHERERVLVAPEMVVLSPEPVDAPGSGWIADLLPGTAAVYRNPAVLWRGARALFAAGALVTPDDMRPMIEAAAEGDVPEGLAAQTYRAVGVDQAAGGIARQNVLDFRRGYTPGSGAWEPDTHTPTRLEDRPQITLRLARREGDRIVPYAPIPGAGSPDDVRRAWSLSEVSVAQYRLATCPIPTGWEEAAKAARQGWGRWERESERIVLALLEVTDTLGVYTLAGQAEDGSLVEACYLLQDGLIVKRVPPRHDPCV